MQGTAYGRPLLLLLDSGCATSRMNKHAMPKNIHGHMVPKATGSTLAGTFTSDEQVCLEDSSLPDFHPKQTLPKFKACVFHAECCYDMIIGLDVLHAFSVKLDFEDHCIVCDKVSVPMHKFPAELEIMLIEHLPQDYLDRLEDDEVSASEEYFMAEILDGSYEPVDTRAVVDSCKHFSPEQCEDL